MFENIILALSGLGLFLYAMILLEEAMREAAGRSFKRILQESTGTIFKSILVGTVTTAIVQSSSIVSLIVLSLVGAGLMNLRSGIGVIFGANIGTTFTAWLVALLGFKLNVESFALPMAGIGGFLLLFFQDQKKLAALAKLLIALGILFLGLNFMKESMDIFAKSFDLKEYANYPIYIMVIIGFVLTAIIQSSSASTAIFLTALHSNIITFEMAAALTIGANVGTTITAMLGAIGGTPDKKRIAAAHFIFNVGTAILALPILSLMDRFILDILGLRNDLTTGLALFHTLFNVLGVLIFSPFIPYLSKLLNRFFTKVDEPLAKYITKVPTDIPEVAIEALKNEAVHLFYNVLEFGLFIFNVRPKDVLVDKLKTKEVLEKNSDILDINYIKLYKNLKKLEILIISYANDIKSKELKEDEVKAVNDIVYSVERMIFAAKTLKDIKDDIDNFASSVNENEYRMYQHFRKRVVKLFKNLERVYEGEIERAEKIVQIYHQILNDNEEALTSIALWIKEYDLDEETAATILNVNRAIYQASKNLLQSADRLFLPNINIVEE
ncbi:Na/Pi cotransporter family protein [Nitrosophilus kaiyonis]|uniref:Na/Pi cotransporter family protein n=1 Tax=Nitrosophilus kaiyonis TaxID=2930200 RepID=UPI0024936C3A|nr:Na/Pi symporter [Nitrosophilus kaiyonis]